ncbi:MAG TPA: DUF2945 domain-containing protein [Streptosporangiaceae bacterium]|nr:DUF2945 domain-containing protein [Streptosporangiaceae bacterium]
MPVTRNPGAPRSFTEARIGSPRYSRIRVRWNSEAGYVEGVIIKVHTHNVEYKGYVHHASESDPQYEIKSDKTDHIAMHKGGALTKI